MALGCTFGAHANLWMSAECHAFVKFEVLQISRLINAGIIDGYSPHASPALWNSDPESSDNEMEGLTLGYPTNVESEPTTISPKISARRAAGNKEWQEETRTEDFMDGISSSPIAAARVDEGTTRAVARELATYTPIGAFDSEKDADAEGEMCYG
ncbi:hypothetical protein DFH07DRAFT_974743 [Mycena maculata]|uniref:Uncharacterized protein n=1 Tax=Mycena maculata TaxID=230809 RepID=A0AAD7MEF8_9AGAR|nr:hypothetical protein DFH07DRAFT_974743 [Mycena maculata]